jgi:serine/threonine protein kinase
MRSGGFAREASTIALLSHPNICTIYDVDTHEGRQFIAMERVPGVTLKTIMAREDLDLSRLLDIGGRSRRRSAPRTPPAWCTATSSPETSWWATTGHVKVLDFGLARQFRMPGGDPAGLEGSTIPGRPLGTANYMAPERILQMPLDPRSDLFSLGVILYEMATGRLPFAGASPSDTVTNVLDRDPEALTTLAPDRPAALEHVVMRLLAKRRPIATRARSTWPTRWRASRCHPPRWPPPAPPAPPRPLTSARRSAEAQGGYQSRRTSAGGLGGRPLSLGRLVTGTFTCKRTRRPPSRSPPPGGRAPPARASRTASAPAPCRAPACAACWCRRWSADRIAAGTDPVSRPSLSSYTTLKCTLSLAIHSPYPIDMTSSDLFDVLAPRSRHQSMRISGGGASSGCFR